MAVSVKSIYHENKAIFKALFVLLACIVLCRITAGFFVAVIAIVGLMAFTKNKPGVTMLAYMAMPMLIQVNGTLRGGGSMFGMLCRVCPLALTGIILIQTASRTGKHVVPLGMLYLYLVIALVSSMNGWCPPISYLKVVNFLVFLIAMHLGMRNMHHHPNDLLTMRNGLMAFCIFVIAGSIAVIPFPSIGYSMMLSRVGEWTIVDNADAFIKEFQGLKLYSGVTNHSQTLGPLTVACVSYVLCDMLFIERRLNHLHIGLLALSPIILYMTRSRMGLLGYAAAMTIIWCYTIPKANVERRVKSSIRNIFLGLALIGAMGLAVMEIKDQTMTKWLRKTEDVQGDERGLSEAITASRQGVIEQNMYDFHKNPLWGMGFQVSEEIKMAYQAGRVSVFSAPIEKGLLPLMVLGETGVIGAIVFGLFLITFYGTCASRRYVCTASLMTVYLVLNMAEASFFSPGGLGGALWVLLLGGGFTIDMMNVNFQQKLREMRWGWR